MEDLGFKPMPVWNASIADGRLTDNDTMQVLAELFELSLLPPRGCFSRKLYSGVKLEPSTVA